MAFLLEKVAVEEIDRFPSKGLLGRRKIKTNVAEITADNVKEVLSDALSIHFKNAMEIKYLWNYYRGRQDIQFKEKCVRENINNKVTINRAMEIVTFKTAYLLNEPIQYVSNGSTETVSNKISKLNDFMRAEDKESVDKETIDWMHICGVCPRLVLPDEDTEEIFGAPYHIYTLDPREAFVIYSSRIGQKPLGGVVIQKDEDNENIYTVYTDNKCFIVSKDKVDEKSHILGGIPIVEYIANPARMGAFEGVISILNNINTIESNAVDSVQDFVNGFDVFQNCDIADGEYQELGLGGKAVKIKTVTQGMEAKVYRIVSELSQSGVQQRIDDFTESYLTICGMPNRNGGSSTSDTGQAVIFRDGWSEAESRAKDTEKLFKRSEYQMLRIVLKICEVKGDLQIDLKDIGINFARKSLNNLQSKIQCFNECLASGWVHPEDVYKAFGDVFGDKELAYRRGLKWHEQQKSEEEASLKKALDDERERVTDNEEETDDTRTVQSGGSGGKSDFQGNGAASDRDEK